MFGLFRRAANLDLIGVMPKNYRSIALKVIEIADDPRVFLDKQLHTDYSTRGRLTQRGIRACLNFEIRDGEVPILGFHDHPNEMWFNEKYRYVAEHCAAQGWLKFDRVITDPHRHHQSK